MHRFVSLFALVLHLAVGQLALARPAAAHCQVPCGIFDDAARVAALLEDAATVAKADAMLAQLHGKPREPGKQGVDVTNQQVRWVMTKEEHAQRVIDTVANYFLAQRVKADQPDYAERLQKHHAVIVAAVQAKQTAAPAAAQALKTAIEALRPYYPAHAH